MGASHYLWGFPGIGKSTLRSDLHIQDVDCASFQFQLFNREGPVLPFHGEPASPEAISPDPDYPRNYLEYIKGLHADIVLLNCHISLLNELDPERVLLVYPSENLKTEYLERYKQRGDNDSFIAHMDTCFEEMIATIRHSPYRKYEVKTQGVFLQKLLDGGIIMDQFMTKKDLTALFEESLRLGVFKPPAGMEGRSAVAYAQMLFEGDISVDISKLKKELESKREEIRQEQIISERRGGLSHEQLRDKILQGIVNGALHIHHDQIAPYSYGYEVTLRSPDLKQVKHRWECYCSFPEVAESVTKRIEAGGQSSKVIDIKSLIACIDEKEKQPLTSYVPEAKAGYEPRGRYTGHVATWLDVQQGKALDGIMLGHFSGDYSSMTTSKQNDLLKTLVIMKGFCLDCMSRCFSRQDLEFAIEYLKSQGTDVSTPEKLHDWIMKNPEKCGLPENRSRVHTLGKGGKPPLDSQISSANEKRDHVPSSGKSQSKKKRNDIFDKAER